MALIALEGMQFYAYHGFYKEEQLIGADYIVDVYITSDINQAAVADDLYKTINYETVYLICEAAMRTNAKLIENVAARISLNLKFQFGGIKELKIRIRKKNPPLGGQVAHAMVETEGSFTKKCARCNRPMLCYSDRSCWCMAANIKKAVLEHTKSQYGNQCLCQECLSFFAG
jgi:dihydroneopterin aldolase